MELESRYVEIDSYKVHYWVGGQGFPILMIHGVGPGTSIVGNFEPALSALSERYHLFATDLIGFGGSARKITQPYFDVDLWVKQGLALLNEMPAGPVGVAGHSLGGALALKIAASSEKVTHVLTSSTVGTPYPINQYLDAFWSLPAKQSDLRGAMENMVYNPVAVTDQMIEGRWDLLTRPGYSEYFRAMFGGERQRYIDAGVVTDQEIEVLNTGNKKISMIHGLNDKPCPAALTTEKLGERLPNAVINFVERCGHNLPREYTGDYLKAAFELYPSGNQP